MQTSLRDNEDTAARLRLLEQKKNICELFPRKRNSAIVQDVLEGTRHKIGVERAQFSGQTGLHT